MTGQLERAKARSPELSRLLRRSGVGCTQICDLLDWTCDHIYQIGLGTNHHEVIVMLETWPDIKFTGFEPCPRIYKERLDGHVEMDKKYRQIEGRIYDTRYPGELYPYAIGSERRTATIYTPKQHLDATSLFKPRVNKIANESEVQVETLDGLYPNGPDEEHILLWIDCEGMELDALKGGEKFVESVEVINVEMTAKPANEGECDIVELHYWLLDHGFYRQWIHTLRAHCGQVDGVYVRDHLFKPEHSCDPEAMVRYRKRQQQAVGIQG